MCKTNRVRSVLDVLLFLCVLPLAGVVVAGKPVRQYLEFPPLTQYVEHAAFSWLAFMALAVLTAAVMLPFIIRVLRSRPHHAAPAVPVHPFPWWGWLGVAVTGVNWVLAWNRFAWFAPLQPFTFSPFWFGYILLVNGLTFRRSGHCMLRDRPGYTGWLFVVSAVFWWYFEYLNRFVQNWHYEGIGGLSGLQYFVYATLPFSTVLPAVLGTRDLLGTYPRLSSGLGNFMPVHTRHSRVWARIVLILSCFCLAGLGLWPDVLFPLLWLAPLFVITSLQCIRGRRTLFSDLAQGNWRPTVLLALAALICGFFWELWNLHSLAKWVYSVPFVGRFKLFEMPILGYAGYLPFGLECAVVADFVLRREDHETIGAAACTAAARPPSRLSDAVVYTNKTMLALFAGYFFFLPGFTVMRNLADPRLRDERIPQMAWRLHRDLSPRYASWARARVAAGVAAHLNLHDVPGTEWPMFGSVYYLWATEALQKAWEQDPACSREAPAVYARETIDAAVDLILDPLHHTWVKTHWGEDYLHHQNVFFRSMIIAACTSHENLIGDGAHLERLRDQVESLAAALDASPHGVLEDYPGECYPIDVLAAIACIRRADPLLGTDHSAFARRALRAFSGENLDACGLPPYLMDVHTARHLGPSRGTGNSYVLIFAPELWPGTASGWYERYEQHFWQKTWWAEGWREYPRTIDPEFDPYMDGRLAYDVDAGPIIAGFSPAANAFGFAAAVINGRLDHAYTLGSQIIAATWPLPNGSLLGPQILSSLGHAPYLGEACILFFLAQTPHDTATIVTGGHKPGSVIIGYVFYFGTGLALLLIAGLGAWRYRLLTAHTDVPCQCIQFAVWAGLLLAAIVLLATRHPFSAVSALLIAQLLPFRQRRDANITYTQPQIRVQIKKPSRSQQATLITLAVIVVLSPLTILAPGFRKIVFGFPAARLSAALLGAGCMPVDEGYMVTHTVLPVWVSLDCSGVSFFVLLTAMWLGLAYRYRQLTPATGGALAAAAYALTVLVNTCRITLGWHAAVWARAVLPSSMWAGVHLCVGVLVFLCALVGAYAIAESLSGDPRLSPSFKAAIDNRAK